jgi:hypothetical chaperone protein
MIPSLGLDFGTTNTVLATCSAASGAAAPLKFSYDGEWLDTLRSALCFWKAGIGPRASPNVEAGPWAIEHYIDDPSDCRFLQSLKSFAASPYFQQTYLYGKRFRFEDLLSVFFERVRSHAGDGLRETPKRLVVGRPVTFVGASADPQLAMDRYREALAGFGFSEILFVYEPVAAAFFFARKLTRNAKILVADFGGGTTDYSVMQFTLDSGAIRAEPLAHGGVGVAGDTFDRRIIDHVVLPRVGAGGSYRSMGKVLNLPQGVFASFGQWNHLSILKSSAEFRDLKHLLKYCLDQDAVRRFIDLVEDDQGYPLYRAVSGAKARLSMEKETEFAFPPLGHDFRVAIRRDDFDTWIAGDLARMETALDVTLAQAGLDAADVDRVFLTGGTSFVPAVRKMFERRFTAEKIESGDELLSIANGLALIGQRDDAATWAC